MTINDNIQRIRQCILQVANQHQRNAATIRLIAVTKGQPIDAIKQAFLAGVTDFGESYWQEARYKINALQNLAISWHFIGPLQSNKTASIATCFDWVHSVCREKIANILANSRPSYLPALNICLQVNLDNEPGKAGLALNEVNDFAKLIVKIPNLTLRGLMAIPAPSQNSIAQYQSLLRLSQLLTMLNQSLPVKLDTLSMGMSDDLTSAICAGSTMIRVGRAIFGPRK
jgi:pyridoxal phosphate enzyme (YggS family)